MSPTRQGLTRVELLIVFAMLSVLLALLAPAVLTFRRNATRTECMENLKLIGLAARKFHDVHKRLPPGVGSFPMDSGPYGSVLFHLLPYLEQASLYEKCKTETSWRAENNGVSAQPVSVFLCPSNPTIGKNGVVTDSNGRPHGASCFAGNAQVFCKTKANGTFVDSDGERQFAEILDGLATTILFAEKYARCTNPAAPEGGSFWAYDDATRTGEMLLPGFAISWVDSSIGPGSKFQVQPAPDNCNPTLAQTPHRNAMMVCWADGSVRPISSDISGAMWWAACTPNGEDVFVAE